jgi:hypothetical protein
VFVYNCKWDFPRTTTGKLDSSAMEFSESFCGKLSHEGIHFRFVSHSAYIGEKCKGKNLLSEKIILTVNLVGKCRKSLIK